MDDKKVKAFHLDDMEWMEIYDEHMKAFTGRGALYGTPKVRWHGMEQRMKKTVFFCL